MKIDFPSSLARAVPALPLIVPLAVVVLAYVIAVQPRMTAARQTRTRIASLQNRLVELQAIVREASPTRSPREDSLLEFERQTPQEDRLSEVLERLAGLADGPAVGKFENLWVETGSRVEPPAQAPDPNGAPRVAGPASEPLDPRIDLFRVPVAYTPVTITCEATYPQAGSFFWNLRNLPTTFELRSLELSPSADPALLQVRLVLFVFQRSGNNSAGPRTPAVS